jgi:iron complex outermembrane recepter protein
MFMRGPARIVLNATILLIIHFTVFSTSASSKTAGEKENTLEEVTVTATRLERQTLDVPASVDVAGAEQIKDANMFNIKEVLQTMPGVLIQSPNQGYDTRLVIRGSGLKARYGVRDIMVLLDGVPITDPDSFTRLDFIDPQLISQIEVVKGPNSTLWGANAAGGVINVLTKSPYERRGGIAKFGVGDYGTVNGHLSFSDSPADRFYYTASVSRRQTDNDWRRWNEFETTQGSLQSALIFDDESSLESYFGYTDASIQLPGKLDRAMFEHYLRTGAARQTEGPWQYSGRYSEIFFFNSRWTKQIGDFELKPMVFINSWNHRHPVTGRINQADTNTYGLDMQVNHTHRLLNQSGTLTFGATGRFDDQETDYFKYAEYITGFGGRITEVLSDKRGNRIETQKRKTELYGIYLQESFHPAARWGVDLGMRYDEVRFDISGTRTEDYDYSTGTYAPATDPEDIDKSFSSLSPRLGISRKLMDGLSVYCQFSKGIQTPTEGELSENPQLNLVQVTSYEVGLKTRFPRWSLDSALYYSPVDNEVVQVVGPGGQTQYVNSGKTDKKGFEVSASWYVLPTLELGGAYSYTHYTFDDFSEPVNSGGTTVNVDRSGNRLPFVPENQFSLFVSCRHCSGLRLRMETLFWGSYYMDNANSEEYEGYAFITNAMAAYEKGPLEISLNADNLFDKYYATEVEKDTRGVVRYTPAAPRRLMLRIAYNF